MGTSVFGKAKNDCSWGCWEEGPGQCLGEGVGAKTPNNFRIKHTKMMIVRVNIR